MKTITLTENEIDTLCSYLLCEPCEDICLYGYVNIHCEDINDNGDYKCEFMRNTKSIIDKLGIRGKNFIR